MLKRLILLTLSVCLLGVTAAAEELPEVPEMLLQEVNVGSVSFDMSNQWVLLDTEGEGVAEDLLLWANSLDASRTLLIFFTGEGGMDKVMELAATNEYSGFAERSGMETYGDISVVYATAKGSFAVYAYVTDGASVYTATLTYTEEDDPDAQLAELKEMLSTARYVVS